MNLVFLIGYMAVGKTTVGRALAEKVGCRHIDLDEEIAIRTGNTVQNIISGHGEEFFRHVEQQVLSDVIDEVGGRCNEEGRQADMAGQMTVISAGGGTPCYSDNMDVMRRAGCVVWLQMSVYGIVQRLAADRAGRPLLANVGDRHLCCVVGRHLAMRRMFYSKAHIQVDVDGMDVGKIVGAIIEKLETDKTSHSGNREACKIQNNKQ
ncbi:MAG: shikimate kinase [Candidatus Aphodosoma sp.]